MSSGCATRAIAQMKPTISRAIAMVTTTFGLPIAARRRYRAHNRTQPGQQTVKSISTRTGFVAEVEATPMLAKPSNQFAQDVGAVLEYANLSYLPTAAALGNRPASRRLV